MGANIDIRPVRRKDASALADLLNEIIAQGGTTALEDPVSADELTQTMLINRDVVSCFVAEDVSSGQLLGFQTVGLHPGWSHDIGDIATFARIGLTQKGVGSALFAATRAQAQRKGLTAINATIRADNSGGLAFYSRMGFVDHDVTRAKPLKDGTPVDRIHKRYAVSSEA